MRQCRPLPIGGRSRPKRALTASAICPFGRPGLAALGAATGPGLAAGGSDCSIGPLGAAGAGTGAGATGGASGCAGPGEADRSAPGADRGGGGRADADLRACAGSVADRGGDPADGTAELAG